MIEIIKCLSAQPVNTEISTLKNGKTKTVRANTGIIAYVIKSGKEVTTVPKDKACEFIFKQTAKEILKKDDVTLADLEALTDKQKENLGVIKNAKISQRKGKPFLQGKDKSFYDIDGMVECIFKTTTAKKKKKDGTEYEAVVVATPREVTKPEYKDLVKLAPEKTTTPRDPKEPKKQTTKSADALIKIYGGK